MGGTRWRGAIDPSLKPQVPGAAVDPSAPGYVYWWTPTTQGTDPFVAGATWGLYWSLTTVFGDLIGGLLADATMGTVQRLDVTGQYVPWA